MSVGDYCCGGRETLVHALHPSLNRRCPTFRSHPLALSRALIQRTNDACVGSSSDRKRRLAVIRSERTCLPFGSGMLKGSIPEVRGGSHCTTGDIALPTRFLVVRCVGSGGMETAHEPVLVW